MMFAVLDKLFKTTNVDFFIEAVSKHKQAFTSAVDFLKNHHPEFVEKFLTRNYLYEDLLFLYLENYFNSINVKERTIQIENAKTAHKYLLEKDKEEWKFYTSYLQDLENSIYFKKSMISENYVSSTDTGKFDRSVYQYYSQLISDDKFGYVDIKNKQWFDINQKKLSIIRLKCYAEGNKIDAIKTFGNNIKPNQCSYMAFAEVCIDKNLNDIAAEFLLRDKEEENFEHKMSLLLHIKMYSFALDSILVFRECERFDYYIQEIRDKAPELDYRIRSALNSK